MSDLLTAALSAAERGWHVFPLRPGTKRPALHGESACPRTGPCTTGHLKWEDRATTDPARIRAAWATGDYNIGLATGPSGLVVVDLDKPKDSTDAPDGAANLAALFERAGQPVPRTRTIRTASGGAHLHFSAPAAARLHNTAGTVAPLVDTRAWGGYVVAAGSIVNGHRYEVEGPALIRPLPPVLMALLTPPHPKPGTLPPPAAPAGRSGRYAASVLQRERENVRTAPEGRRNTTLLASVRAVGRFVAWGDLPRDVVETAFQGEGEAVGLTTAECRATITSALNWSIRTCRPRPEAA
ncbi:bifunctional DNA primase/polymerase [Streptomyces sp. NBC_00102]|uniref:bifunctional DNA primase/polymerase n=1 Tax=Streptomyces sp. NBC_00102 TaxID=2975652 RepID=UPI00225124C9|nr:bifunctional DNA primase/polymerase [Streptomyces sp. NBC_00102]MCX5400054.1 bifunctional DNA primase/polymerase [Streptomyces sp. NBC_00102]